MFSEGKRNSRNPFSHFIVDVVILSLLYVYCRIKQIHKAVGDVRIQDYMYVYVYIYFIKFIYIHTRIKPWIYIYVYMFFLKKLYFFHLVCGSGEGSRMLIKLPIVCRERSRHQPWHQGAVRGASEAPGHA